MMELLAEESFEQIGLVRCRQARRRFARAVAPGIFLDACDHCRADQGHRSESVGRRRHRHGGGDAARKTLRCPDAPAGNPQPAPAGRFIRSCVRRAAIRVLLSRSTVSPCNRSAGCSMPPTSRSPVPKAAVRAQGLAVLYACVMQTWVQDEDPGLARTMAVLDRELSRGQRWSGFLDDVCAFPAASAACAARAAAGVTGPTTRRSRPRFLLKPARARSRAGRPSGCRPA